MHEIVGTDIRSLFNATIRILYNSGEITKPRGFNCIELPMVLTLTHPQRNILTHPKRKMSLAYAAAELMWIWKGRNDVEYIAKYNKNIAKYSDDGETFFGAYGPRIMAQWTYAKEILLSDPWSRQSIITIWNEQPHPSKDIPCTISLHFTRRPLGLLNLTVYMRSNDAWLGLPYDVHTFTCLQILMALQLGITVGEYTHIANSMHIYEHDLLKIRDFMAANMDGDWYEKTPVNEKELFEQKSEWMREYELKHSQDTK
jgi:thymidylate synthase